MGAAPDEPIGCASRPIGAAGGVDLAGAVHVEGLLRDKTRKPGKPPLPPNTVQRWSIWPWGRRRAREPTGRAGNLPRRPE
jgi:hypothetical protein